MLVILTNIPTPYRTAFFNVLKKELQLHGIGFHVFYCSKTEPRRFWKFESNLNKYDYTFLRGFHPKFKNYYPHFNPGLIKHLKRLNPKWLLMAGSWNAPSVINVLFRKNAINATLIFWSEGHKDAERNSSRLVSFMRSAIITKMDAFVVPNKKSLDYIRSFNKEAPIGFLPNTIDEDFFSDKKLLEKTAMREKYNLPQNSIIYISVATISDRKGSWELINGFSNLPIYLKDRISLLLLGTGEFEEKIKEFKKKNNIQNLYLLGHQSAECVRDYLHLSDYFILPTKHDPNPLTPIEASFMKKPIILSIKAGNHNEIIKGSTGFSIEKITSEEISKVLLKSSCLGVEEIKLMGESSYQNVVNNFSRRAAGKNLIHFLQKL